MAITPGFRMPAEWAPHAATWIAWPHERSDWPGKFAPVPFLYAEITRILSRHEEVRILLPDKLTAQVKDLLKSAGAWNRNVRLLPTETNRSWTRDFCPTVVCNDSGEKQAVKWRFNGWAKYRNWRKDDAAGELAAIRAKLKPSCPVWGDRRVVLEGGSIDVNGDGSILTTRECLLSNVQERNPGMTAEQYQALFDGWLGAHHVIWLEHGIAGDDTHGHVDDLARFVSSNTVVLATENDPNDPNHAPLAENLEILKSAKNESGKRLKVVELPMPKPVFYDGQRLPASYANFYIANRQVLVPTFHDPSDRIALNTLAKLFPGRDIIGIHCVDLVLGLGTLHCMTMQVPG